MLKVLSDVVLAADNQKVTLLALLDFSAAFDYVDHEVGLLQRSVGQKYLTLMQMKRLQSVQKYFGSFNVRSTTLHAASTGFRCGGGSSSRPRSLCENVSIRLRTCLSKELRSTHTSRHCSRKSLTGYMLSCQECGRQFAQRSFTFYSVLRSSPLINVNILTYLLISRRCLWFSGTNRRAVAMMFVRLCVRPSVCLSGTGVHRDHTVYFSADSSLCLDSSMFWSVGTLSPKHVHVPSAVFFQFHLEERWGVDMQTRCDISIMVELLLSANIPEEV